MQVRVLEVLAAGLLGAGGVLNCGRRQLRSIAGGLQFRLACWEWGAGWQACRLWIFLSVSDLFGC